MSILSIAKPSSLSKFCTRERDRYKYIAQYDHCWVCVDVSGAELLITKGHLDERVSISYMKRCSMTSIQDLIANKHWSHFHPVQMLDYEAFKVLTVIEYLVLHSFFPNAGVGNED